jgi:phage terminase small subunit
MSPVLIEKDLESLKHSELTFIRHLLGDALWRPTVAAKKAGYKNPSQSAQQLIKRPAIARALGKEQRRRLERLELRADEVLHVLATGLFFNPLTLFHPTKDGKWAIEDLDQIPDEIGRCISKIKTKTVDAMDEDGNVTSTTYFEMELMDKTKLLQMAMQHCGVDGSQKIEHSGSVGVDVGLNGGLNGLLAQVEQTRQSQIIDAEVVEKKINGEQS